MSKKKGKGSGGFFGWLKSLFSGGKKEEQIFVREWTEVLRTDADVFNGLFAGLKLASAGQLKKKKNGVLNECMLRAHYRWEGQSIDEINKRCLEPLSAESDDKEIIKWARLILKAAEKAEITCDNEPSLKLDQSNVSSYKSLDGNELSVGEEIEIISPAWYQNGKVIETGYCKRS